MRPSVQVRLVYGIMKGLAACAVSLAGEENLLSRSEFFLFNLKRIRLGMRS
jgi:hypothetical protein